jgi:hypothetical protein
MIIRDFSLEIVREIEIGFNNFLKKSIKYSPFALFYKLFKKSYPQLINDVRYYIAQDIETILKESQNFEINKITNDNYDLSIQGEKLLEEFQIFGFDIIKKYLTVRKAFKLLSHPEVRTEFYELFLTDIKKIIGRES